MFGNLMQKIFHHAADAPHVDDGAMAHPQSTTTAVTPNVATPGMAAPGAPQTPAPGAAATGPVDVEAILNNLASKSSEKLDWRHSIVDTMKLVGMDSSLSARKELAGDLNYSGDTNDSATMNMWLHKEVMKKLAENGGKVPADLL
jgi:hypothetical protein